jgi:hypothetical protein
MKSKIHDPFHDPAPQVPAHIPPPAPPEDVSVDAPGGGRNVKPIEITDPNHRARFVPTHEPERDYKRRK